MDPLLAAQALGLLALVLATYRYARLVRRRALLRRQLREREDAGLRGLVRVLGADQDRRDMRKRASKPPPVASDSGTPGDSTSRDPR